MPIKKTTKSSIKKTNSDTTTEKKTKSVPTKATASKTVQAKAATKKPALKTPIENKKNVVQENLLEFKTLNKKEKDSIPTTDNNVFPSDLKKEYLNGKKTCKVTFTLFEQATQKAKEVNIVGDFNDWDKNATTMEKLGNGNYTATLELKVGREYQFRYLIDKKRWENDWNADKYVPTPFGEENSVVFL